MKDKSNRGNSPSPRSPAPGLLIRLGSLFSGGFHRLRPSERRHRFLTEKMNDVLWTTDLEFNTTYISPSIEKVLGFTPEERIRQSLAEQMPPATQQLAWEKLKEELARDRDRDPDRALTLDLDYYHRDGSIRILETNLSFIRDRRGRPSGIYGLARDVTDQRRVEEQIRERMKELRSLYTLSRLIEQDGLTLEGLYREVPAILAANLQYPEIACARIVVGAREFHTGNFARSPWMKSAPIRSSGAEVGRIEIGYLEKRWTVTGDPFLEEEGNLLKDFAKRIGGVTERKRTQERLASSEERFRAVFDQAKDGIFIESPDGRILDVNRAATDMLGYSREELLKMRVGDLVPPEVVASLASRIRPETVAEGAYIETEELCKDGRRLPIEISNSLVLIGGQERVVAILRDITERKKAAAALRASEERFENILAYASLGIQGYRTDGTVVYWNREAEKLYGYTAEEAQGRNLGDLIIPDELQPLFRKGLEKCAGLKESGEFMPAGEVSLLRKDGSRILVHSIHTAVCIRGQAPMLFCIDVDLTERKKTEAAIRAKSVELEKLTQKLRDALELANRMTRKAEEASTAKSRFLANMSHEIRTPMNGVLGMAGLLLESGLKGKQRRYAEIIETSGRTLLDLINDILDFSKIEAGKLELEKVDFNLEDELERLADGFAVSTAAKGLDFVCRAVPGTPTLLKGDPGKLRQILTNLVGNAIKFTMQGSVTVEASLSHREEGRAILVFTVADTGVGIPPRLLERIFEPFTQADGSTTRHYEGTGLGLTIARQLVEMMDGEISVESAPGRGSTFRFTACFQLQSETAPPSPPSGFEDLTASRGERVLVVDDNQVNRELLIALLRRWGLRAGEAASGQEALAVLREAVEASDPYRAVVLDVMMPGMDGEELARKIKADPVLPRLPLILMSSIGQLPSAPRRKELGISEALAKPVNRSDLARALATVLQCRPRPSPPAPVRGEPASPGKKSVRILVAEDNPVNQKVARGMLQRLGYDPLVVADGREVLKVLAEGKFDLVLMDVQMPVLDGFAAARKIRDPGSDVLDHQVPIIALTAHALEGDRERCLAAGMDDYLPKPISLPGLKVILKKWLEKNPSSGESGGR